MTRTTVTLHLNGPILEAIDRDRKSKPRASFLRQIICEYFHITLGYSPQQAWRILTPEQRAERYALILKLHADMVSQSHIAVAVGVTPAVVMTVLKKNGYVPKPIRRRKLKCE